jgi:hypothetical protein
MLFQTLLTLKSFKEKSFFNKLLGARRSLNRERPLDLLRRGEAAKVVSHAKALAEDGSW